MAWLWNEYGARRFAKKGIPPGRHARRASSRG